MLMIFVTDLIWTALGSNNVKDPPLAGTGLDQNPVGIAYKASVYQTETKSN